MARKIFSGLKKKLISKIRNKRISFKNGTEKLKRKISKAHNSPKSKRLSLFLGFSTVMGIFGITLFSSVFPAFAKDFPVEPPKPNQTTPILPGPVCPTQPPVFLPSQKIAEGILISIAANSGSFLIGGVCGLIIVFGIFKVRRK
jgi:hypothetical protein